MKKINCLPNSIILSLAFMLLPGLVIACDPNVQACPQRTGNAMTAPVFVDYKNPQAPNVSPTDPTQYTCPANTVLGQVTVTQAEQSANDFLASKQEGLGNADCSGDFAPYYSWVYCVRRTVVTQGAKYQYACFPLVQQRISTWTPTPFNY